MSTLKKIFALTLAIAMVMSVAVFADFTDKSSINTKCVDDVNLLSAIGIISGYPEGDFRPEGTIKRSEAAKMIYVLRNGGDDDQAASWKGAASFTDVPATAWYAGYVAYCAQYNIVAGRSATTFDPDAQVTSLELAKMLLVVGGYRADVQGYTGSEWASNVRKDAESAGLLAGYGAALTTAAPRQWAAKMFANSINSRMAVYYGDMLAVNTSDAVTVGKNYLDLSTKTTTILANENWNIDGRGSAAEGKSRFKDPVGGSSPVLEYNDPLDPTKVTGSHEMYEDDFAVANDLVGKEVVVAYNKKNGKNVIIGVSETGKTAAGAITITKSGADDNKWTVKVGDTTLCKEVYASKANEVFNNAKVVYSWIDESTTNKITEAKQKEAPAAINTVAAAYGLVAVNLVDQTATAYDINGDGKINYIVVNPVFFDQVSGDPTSTEIGTVKYAFNLDSSSETKVKCASGLQDEDFVKIMPDYASGEIKIEKLNEVVVGVLSGTAGDKNDKYVIGGTAYETYSFATAIGNTNKIYNVDDHDSNLVLSTLGKSVTAYTDGKYIIRVESTKEAAAALTGKFAYIIDAYNADSEGHTSGTIKIKALLSNGTIATMEFDTNAKAENGYLVSNDLGKDGVGKITGAGVIDKVFEYSTSSEGKIRLRATPTETSGVKFPTTVVKGPFDYDKQTIDGSYVIDEGTYAFVKYKEHTTDEEPSYKVIKGTEFKKGMNLHNLTVYAHSDVKGAIKAAIITIYDAITENGGLLPGMDDTKIVFITSKMYYSAWDEADEMKKNYIQGIDIKTGATETYVIANNISDTTDPIFQQYNPDSDPRKDLTGSFFALTEATDEGSYTFSKIKDGDDNWTITRVTGIGSNAIQLLNGDMYSAGDDKVKDAKVYVRNGNTGVSASSFSAITVGKNNATNIMYHKESADPGAKIDYIIYSANSSKSVDGYQ